MNLLPLEIFAEDNEGKLTDTVVKALVNMLTVTHFQQLPSGHLAIHVMSGRVLVANISFADFVEKQNSRSSILTPR
jgi:hypothetical protein